MLGFTLPVACVDPEDLLVHGTNDILVIDGTITNLAEAQTIRLSRSKADPLTGRFGTLPITKASVEVVVDSTQVIPAHETEPGTYQLPVDFKGQLSHAYQLRFTLWEGTRYQSTQQVMVDVAPINRVYARFNPVSLPPSEALAGFFRAGYDVYLDTQDPIHQPNYYRWDWKLWEKQNWCRSCGMGVYSVNNVVKNYSSGGIRYYTAGDSLFENCFYPPNEPGQPALDTYFVYYYECRTQCWAIFSSYSLQLFSDRYTDGNLVNGQLVGHIPYYQHAPCLVEIRQASLPASAYQYYKQVADQTQKTGTLVDAPPSVLSGNVRNISSQTEGVVGYFTASAVSAKRYWLDRKDATGLPLGATDPAGSSGLAGAELFYALNARQPHPEPSPPTVPQIQLVDKSGRARPFTAICESKDSQTPVKPVGWQD
ncbi:hypothetical protein GCM10028805_36950 [Spirosoma harenae]